MKKLLVTFLFATSFLISCNSNNDLSVELEEFEVINKFDEPIYISMLYELESSHLVDPAGVIHFDDLDDVVLLEPDESQIFSADDIVGYYPNADFCIFIYGFGVPEVEDPTKSMQLISIFIVQHVALIRNQFRVSVFNQVVTH